ncbi:MAG TPA: protein-export chaperone SecB [Stellaceae bacterium]|nr:protein-export chaperone SecB [Stellaceae bacterium]
MSPPSDAAPQSAPPQQLIINAQYVKDLSFESPRSPHSLLSQQQAPEVSLNVDVKARGLGPEVYEVMLTINATAKHGAETAFLVELTYGAVATVQNTPQDVLPFLLFVETPRIMFPFARAILSEATRDGGFPPLMINPIDFLELMRRDQARQQQAQAAPQQQPTLQS